MDEIRREFRNLCATLPVRNDHTTLNEISAKEVEEFTNVFGVELRAPRDLVAV